MTDALAETHAYNANQAYSFKVDQTELIQSVFPIVLLDSSEALLADVNHV